MLSRLFCSLSLLALLSTGARAANYQNFRAAVYVRAYEVQKMKDPQWLKSNWAIIESQLKVDKVYLEVHRDLIIIDAQTLAQAKAFFEAKGITVSGGIATVRNEANLFETFDYSDPSHRAKLREIVTATAAAFDEFIIDDFFFTSSKTESAIKAKGTKTWAEFRTELMTDVSSEVLATARAVNPKIKVIIKYPNWYEHFQGMGYNLETQPPMFDQIYTGTETRDSVYNHQHLQPYHGYQQVRYFDNIKPGANGGGWVDTGNRLVADRYAEQLWVTLFAKAPEIMLFALNELLEPIPASDRAAWQDQKTSFDFAAAISRSAVPTLASEAGYSLEKVDRVLGKLGTPLGIASYRPYHSRGEDFLHNYLGMVGLPIDLHPEFPSKANTVLLTADAGHDPKLIDKIESHLAGGHTVIITSGLLERLQNSGIERIADLKVSTSRTLTHEFWGRRLGKVKSSSEILFPQIHYNTNDSWELVSTMSNGLGYPIIHYAGYRTGSLFVVAIPDNFADLYQLPAGVLDALREIAGRDLWVRLRGPARVSLFAYDNHAAVVESFRDEAVKVSVVTDKSFTVLRDEETGAEIHATVNDQQSVFEIEVKPHSYGVYTAR